MSKKQFARDIMTPNPETCNLNSSIYDAVKIMEKIDVGAVPVVDQYDKCVGIVTDRDICLSSILKNMNPHSTKISEVMTKKPLSCQPKEKIHDVIVKMERKKVRRVPVVDEQGFCVGIISEADLAIKDKNRQDVAEFVDAVSR